MADDIHNISLLLGEIRGTLHALEGKVDTNNIRAEAASAKVLSALDDHDARLDSLSRDTREMREQLADVQAKADDSKLVTDDVKRWRVMGVGALTVVGIGAAWLGANGAVLLDIALNWIKTRLGIP